MEMAGVSTTYKKYVTCHDECHIIKRNVAFIAELKFIV